jgi:hypothetical protein
MQKIIIASGVEGRDGKQSTSLHAFLKGEATCAGTSKWTYPKGARKPKFSVHVIYTLAEFRAALDDAGAWVIYEGHSRWGQGPAFGPADTPRCPPVCAYPVNPWGVHFRMGYDATDTKCVADLLEHAVSPTEYDLLAAKKAAFLPKSLARASLRAKRAHRNKGRGKNAKQLCRVAGAWRELNVCDPELAKTNTCRDVPVLDGRHYYARVRQKGQDEFLTSVVVGSSDLQKVNLKCDFLFMASCSSHEHFYRPLKRRRRATKSRCVFFLTARACAVSHGRNILTQILQRGHSPLTKTGSRRILAALNGEKRSGMVGRY